MVIRVARQEKKFKPSRKRKNDLGTRGGSGGRGKKLRARVSEDIKKKNVKGGPDEHGVVYESKRDRQPRATVTLNHNEEGKLGSEVSIKDCGMGFRPPRNGKTKGCPETGVTRGKNGGT